MVSAAMRTAWIWPWVQTLFGSPYVAPRGIGYPAWLVWGLLVIGALWLHLAQKWPSAQWLTALGGLGLTLAVLAFILHPAGEKIGQWLIDLALGMGNWERGIPIAVVALIVTAALLWMGMSTPWRDHGALWRQFVFGSIALSLLMLFEARGQAGIVTPDIGGAMVVFLLSGLASLAMLAVDETVTIEHARGGEAVALSRPWLAIVSAVILLILLLGWALGQIIHPEAAARALGALRLAVTAIVVILGLFLRLLAYVLIGLLLPLFDLLRRRLAFLLPRMEEIPNVQPTPFPEQIQPEVLLPSWWQGAMTIALVVGLLLGVAMALWLAWRHRAAERSAEREEIERRESILSLALVREQLRELLRRRGGAPPYLPLGDLNDPRQAIRHIYQAFLARAVERGYPRAAAVTPQGYAQQWSALLPNLRDALEQLTGLYLLARYGPGELTDEHARQARTAWAKVEEALRSSSGTPGSVSDKDGPGHGGPSSE